MRTVKRRIGRDLSIDIKTLTNGSPTDLSGRAIKIEVINSAFPSRPIELPFTTKENVINIKWYGTDQNHLGEYRLVVWENFGIPGQAVADLCTTITLVDSTCFESDIDSVEYDVTSVDLGIVNLEVGVRGDSAYETWLQLGHEGSEEDFINWLQEPARIIAEQVATSEAKRIKAETDRVAAEKARQTAESERDAAEVTRIQAESDRVVAENSRDKAEASRSKSESSRTSAESARVKAEEARAAAESGRKKSELARQTSESDRQQAETTREQAESVRKQSEETRIASEQIRTTAESARAKAEGVRAAAEQARESAEAKRQQDTAAAIKNAETATTAANDAAGKADEAAQLAKDTIDVVGVGEVQQVPVDMAHDGKYLNFEYKILSISRDCFVSKPIRVRKGDTIIGSVNATTNIAIITQVDSIGTIVLPLLRGNEGTTEVYYVCDRDMYICFSAYKNKFSLRVIPCKLAEQTIKYSLSELYKAGGAVYNEDKGLWVLNGVELTDKDIAEAYNNSMGLNALDIIEVCASSTIKTTFAQNVHGGFVPRNGTAAFRNCKNLMILSISKNGLSYFSNIAYMLLGCNKLETIITIIDCEACSDTTRVTSAFRQCNSLTNIRLQNLKVSLSFSDSPLLNNESILYLITNAGNKSITITLHPDAYARAMSDSSITAALAAKPLITIAK